MLFDLKHYFCSEIIEDMKLVLRIIFLLFIGFVIAGYSLENFTEINGKLYIGIGVVLFAFVFMPFFIYYRYKDRVGNFIDDRMEQTQEEE